MIQTFFFLNGVVSEIILEMDYFSVVSVQIHFEEILYIHIYIIFYAKTMCKYNLILLMIPPLQVAPFPFSFLSLSRHPRWEQGPMIFIWQQGATV